MARVLEERRSGTRPATAGLVARPRPRDVRGTLRPIRPWLLAWLALLPVALLRATTMAEPDTFWETRAGLEILRHGALPAVDTFSWTAGGKAWTLNSWAFDVLLGVADRVGGLPLVALLGGAFIALILALALLLGQRLGASPMVAAAVLWLSAPLVIAWLSVRPQLVDYGGTLALVLLLRALARRSSPLPALVGIGALTVVWVNLHAAAVFELGILAAAVALSLLRRLTRVWTMRWLTALLVAAVSCLANPYGGEVLLQTSSVRSASASVVTEWQPANLLDPTQGLILAAGGLALVIALRRRDPVLAGALLVSGGGTVLALRLLPVLWLLTAPVLATVCSRPRVVSYLRSRRPVFLAAGVLAPAAMLAATAAGLPHLGQPNPTLYPGRTVVQAIPSGCRVFNTYLHGGLLLLERPDVLVSIDSRNDLYGRAAVLANARALTSGDDSAVPGEAGCALLPPGSRLADAVRSDPGWALRAEDPAALLFIRR